MGTNYYTKVNDCDKCGRFDEVHLGKSSMGWTFSFQYNGGQYYKSIPEMKEWLKDKQILDEYEHPVTYDEFWKMVESKQTESNKKHAREDEDSHSFLVGEYSFTDCEFS